MASRRVDRCASIFARGGSEFDCHSSASGSIDRPRSSKRTGQKGSSIFQIRSYPVVFFRNNQLTTPYKAIYLHEQPVHDDLQGYSPSS